MNLEDATATGSLLNLEEFGTPPALNEQLFNLDMSTTINSLNFIDQSIITSMDNDDQANLHRLYSSTKPLVRLGTDMEPLARSRVGYAIDQLKSAPRMMVENNSTLWCHAMFYDENMPRLLQDAHAASALYNARNDINAELIVRHITNRVDELIAMPLPTAPVDVIARAHAMMLYQIMLVFGGNLRFYRHAEALIPHLEDVGNRLLEVNSQALDSNDSTNQVPLYPMTTARAAWELFMFQETLRRTLLSLFQLVALCRLLHGQSICCTSSLSRGNKVTLSSHLWRARNAFEFAIAWNEKKHFLVHNLDFTELLSKAQPDDIDDFAKILLVSLRGIDDVKGWFYTKGGLF